MIVAYVCVQELYSAPAPATYVRHSTNMYTFSQVKGKGPGEAFGLKGGVDVYECTRKGQRR